MSSATTINGTKAHVIQGGTNKVAAALVEKALNARIEATKSELEKYAGSMSDMEKTCILGALAGAAVVSSPKEVSAVYDTVDEMLKPVKARHDAAQAKLSGDARAERHARRHDKALELKAKAGHYAIKAVGYANEGYKAPFWCAQQVVDEAVTLTAITGKGVNLMLEAVKLTPEATARGLGKMVKAYKDARQDVKGAVKA